MKNETYDFLKFLVTAFIPAFVTFYVTCAKFLPSVFVYPEIVAGIVSAVAVAIGQIMKYVSENNYWKKNKIVPIEENENHENGE